MGLIVTNKSYTDEQGRTYSQYIANVLDKRSYEITVELDYKVTLSGSISVNKVDNMLFLPASQSWESFGVVEGCTMDGVLGGGLFSGLTVTHVSGSTLVANTNFPGANQVYDTGYIDFDITPESFEFYDNFIPASDTTGENSLIDGNPVRFVVEGVDTLAIGGTAVFSQLGNKSGGGDQYPIIERTTDLNGRKRFIIRVNDQRNWMYLDSTQFEFGTCVKPWQRISAISQTANPSVRITAETTSATGNTGFFGESFNGGQPYYYSGSTIDGVYQLAYCNFDVSGDSVNQFDHSQTTHFSLRVNGKFSASSKFGLAFFRQADDEETDNLPNPVSNNVSLACQDNLAVGTGNPDIVGLLNSSGAGVNIEDINIQQFSTYAIISGNIVPNSSYTNYIEDNPVPKLYRFAVKVEDYQLTGDNIKPVWLTASYTDSEIYKAPLGEWTDEFGYTLFNHNGDNVGYVFGTVAGEPTAVPDTLVIEDNANMQFKMRIPRPTVQASTGQFFTGVTVSAIARKFDGTKFAFESFSLPFGSIISSDDTMFVDATQNRALNLQSTCPYNKVTMQRSPSEDDANGFGIQIDYGFLVDWRYWESQANANSVFFPFQTKEWFHYQVDDGADWGVFIEFALHTTDGDYINRASIKHDFYDSWGGVALADSEITFHLPDGTLLTSPIEGQQILVRATHTLPIGTSWNPPNIWGDITVEQFENAPRYITSTSYNDDLSATNPFTPITGYTKLKATYSANVATFETLVDFAKLNTFGGVKFTSRIQGESRKGEDLDIQYNRKDLFTTTVKAPITQTDDERSANDCCEKRKVVGDLTDTASYKNDVTSHVESGEVVVFKLYKNGVDTGMVVDSIPMAEQAFVFYAYFNWRFILGTYGAGCYTVKSEIDYAGLTVSKTLENYQLLHWSVEACANDVRVNAIYNAEDFRNGIIYNNSNVLDSLRINGQFNYSQPNLTINNYTKTNYEQNKITRQAKETFELRTGQLCDKYVKLLKYMLQHENYLLISDYCIDNPRYDIKDLAVILTETPTIIYSETGSRTVSMTAKFEEKVLNNISTFSNDNPQTNPISITFANGGIANIENSDGSFTVSFDASTVYILPDTEIKVYLNGVLDSTATFPTLEPITNVNITL